MPKIICTKCGETMRKNGTTSKGNQRYKCKNNHSFTVDGGTHGGARNFNPSDTPPMTNAERVALHRYRRQRKIDDSVD